MVDEQFVCPFCDKKFDNRTDYLRHINGGGKIF